MKRIISLLLVFVLVLALIPVGAQAATGGKLVALTFDDGPSQKLTPQLLDGLKKRDVNVTFFMQGQWAEDYIDIVRRAYDEGHEIANHTWNHPTLTNLSTSSIKSQISRTNDVFDTVCGEGTDYLIRPPGGSTNSTVRSAVGAPLIHWSVDTNDWKYRNYSHVYNHIINNAYDGAIILCHDIHSTTIPAALDAIDVLLERGYEFVTVSELFRRRGVAMEDGVRYYECEPTGKDFGRVPAPKITYKNAQGGGVRVTITSPSGAPVYYNTDGSRLNQESALYTGSFVVDKPCTIHAVAAFNMNGGRSDAVSVKIEKMPSAAPQMTFTDGKLRLSTSTKGASVYYTLNGKKPGTSSTEYSSAITLRPGTVIRAVSGGSYFTLSKETKAYYSEKGNFFMDVMPGDWFADAMELLVEKEIMLGVGGGYYAPGEKMTRGMLVTLLHRGNDTHLGNGWQKTYPFTDVPKKAWYSRGVEWAYRNEIVDGYPGNVFKPDQNITRQEMAQIIARYFDYTGYPLPEGEDCRNKFRDGDKISGWALDSMNAVVAAGLLQGDENNRLNPSASTTRAEFAVVMVRILELKAQMKTKP